MSVLAILCILVFFAGLIIWTTIVAKAMEERVKDLEEQKEIYITEIIELKNKLKEAGK